MEELKGLIKVLKTRRDSFTKNPNRKFSDNFILNSVTILQDTHNSYLKLINKLDRDKSEVKTFSEAYIKIYQTFRDILQTRQAQILTESRDENFDLESEYLTNTENKMANFDLYQSMKIIPEFKGKFIEIDHFLSITELVYESLANDTEKAKLINFIWSIKIEPNAKIRLNSQATPKNFNELKKILADSYPNRDTVQTLHSQLYRVTQNGSTLEQYMTKIEAIILKLNRLNKETIVNGDADTIVKLNEQLALNVFKEGLTEPLKSFVVAARPTTFVDAAKLAKEMEATNPTASSKNVSYINTNHNKNKTSYQQFQRDGQHSNRRPNYKNNPHFQNNRQFRFQRPNNYQNASVSNNYNYSSANRSSYNFPRPNDASYRNNYQGQQYRDTTRNNYQSRWYSNNQTGTRQQNSRVNYIVNNDSKNEVPSPQGRADVQQELEQEFQNLQM